MSCLIEDDSETVTVSEQSSLKDLPASVEWPDKVVGPVKNQGSCGSCWAFAAVGGLQSLHAIKAGQYQPYSE